MKHTEMSICASVAEINIFSPAPNNKAHTPSQQTYDGRAVGAGG